MESSNTLNKIKREIHPKAKSNFLSHLFFCWEIPLFIKGLKKELDENDLYEPLQDQMSTDLGNKLEELWQDEISSRKSPSLWRPLIKMFGWKFLCIGLVIGPIELCIVVLQPHFLKKILEFYTSASDITQQEAYIYGALIVVLSLVYVLAYHWQRMEMTTLGMKARIACSSLIYRTMLKLNKIELQKSTIGAILNLLSNDVNRLDILFLHIHYTWIAPIQFFAGIYYLDIILGHTVLAGCGIILTCLLLQVLAFKQLHFRRKQTAIKTDFRIRLMNDILTGIKVIKMHAWENPFKKLVEASRKIELHQVKFANYFRFVINSLKMLLNSLSLLFCFLTAVLTSLPVTSQYVFVAASVYLKVRIMLGIVFMRGLMAFTEAKVSIERIEDFLKLDQKRPIRVMSKKKQMKIRKSNKISNCYTYRLSSKSIGVFCDNTTIKWDKSPTNFSVSDITFSANSGEMICVIGGPGSGKSTLLQAILKENIITKGTLNVEGSVSYAAQEPWIFPASFRQNILFGEEMDEVKYSEVLRVCALEHDLSILPYSDQTLVGERGVMLSGGQKARVSLARAVYRDADIYLLDDPLSAVDVNVGRQIFNECILGYLKKKCVVLVTHQIHYVRTCKRIYLIENGKMKQCEHFNNFDDNLHATGDTTTIFDAPEKNSQKIFEAPSEIKEHRTGRGITRNLYKNYFSSGGQLLTTITVISLFILAEFFNSFSDLFLTFWVNVEHESSDFYLKLRKYFTTNNCLFIYAALTVLIVIITNLAIWVFANYSKRVSKNLHNRMLVSLFNTTMTFFNNHSSGRILNRFSKDLGCIDEVIPVTMVETFTVFLYTIGTYVVISALNYWMVIPTIAMFVIVYCYYLIFYPTNKNLKRTEAITRSPILTHLAASVQGSTTIRAFKAEKILEKEFDEHQNLHTSAFYLSYAVYATLAFWIDFTCIVYTGIVIGGLFLLRNDAYAAEVGLVVTKSMSLINFAQYGIKLWAELDTHMVSVERIIEYTELKQEKNNAEIVPSESWPKSGSLTFQSVSMRYSPDGPFALDQVSFQINPNEKIGIIGRTGAGKSSLISALFRLFEFEGKIIIDGVNTKLIPLSTLRKRISVIPQEPVLFFGTLRKNLDPFDEFTDKQLWDVLEEVQMKDVVSGLEDVVLEGGSNFSVGQKQLMCLARAMLCDAKIIVLDEATANVDLKTDRAIQMVIRKKFQNCSVLIIAHRLNTIVDSDRILVMDQGRVKEYGHLDQLDSKGPFYNGAVNMITRL